MQTGAWPQDLADLPPADILIADSYRFPAGVQSKWREKFRVRAVLDDRLDRDIDAEIVVNGNLYGDAEAYRGWYSGDVLAGPQYAPIDPDFFAGRAAKRDSPQRILISFGGTDDGALSAPIASAILSSNSKVHIDLVVSALHEALRIPDALRREPRLRLLRGGDIPKLMAASSLFIGGAGVSIMEAAAADTPSIAVRIAGNQDPNIAIIEKAGGPVVDRAAPPEQVAGIATSLLGEKRGNVLAGMVMPGGPDRIADAILGKLRGS